MRLYSGMSEEFVRDNVRNQIASKLESAFIDYYRYKPSPSEVNSWRNSLGRMAMLVGDSGLMDQGVLVEYQLPLSSKRLDFMLCGHDAEGLRRAVIVELKQWETCEPSEADKVVSWLGGANRPVLHPSVQAGQYLRYLEDSHEAFHPGPASILLRACSYLHNYELHEADPLLDAKFSDTLSEFPLFSMDDSSRLASFLKTEVGGGDGKPVLDQVENSRFRPSRKLMDCVAETISEQSPWVLLDEQLVVYEQVLAAVAGGVDRRKKQVVIICGGPGTGKSVVAINLLAELLRRGKAAHYATGSKAFTETLWKILGSRSKPLFRYFNSYRDAEYDSIDVLICDESHRIRKTSDNRFTKKEKRSTQPQIHELIAASKVSVFFVDDKQVVRPKEIGSSSYIEQEANSLGAETSAYELEVQFRCAGSDGFVNWINNTLGIERTANILWDGADGFDFQILDSPSALDRAIRAKAKEGFSARLAAGFCWPWSKPEKDGTLAEDVVIGEFRRPWNAKPDSGRLAPGIPKSSLWATDPNGIDQIGCVYTIQGFELDYVGVIWGPDLKYDFETQSWVGDKKASADNVVKRSKDQFLDLVKNTYRVLLSRGLKGCYVHFMDRDTERFVRSRMEAPAAKGEVRWQPAIVYPKPDEQFVTCVPLVPLKAAAGAFSDPERIEDESWPWTAVESRHKLRKGMFVAQVVGKSMEPNIPDGSYCLFRSPVEGSRQGKIVLTQLRDAIDLETGQRYTVKRYKSEKAKKGDSWQHEKITLKPINPEFKTIELHGEEGELRVIAELVQVFP